MYVKTPRSPKKFAKPVFSLGLTSPTLDAGKAANGPKLHWYDSIPLCLVLHSRKTGPHAGSSITTCAPWRRYKEGCGRFHPSPGHSLRQNPHPSENQSNRAGGRFGAPIACPEGQPVSRWQRLGPSDNATENRWSSPIAPVLPPATHAGLARRVPG